MKWLVSTVCFLLATGLVTARADDEMAIAVEGAYLLIQDNGSHRVLSFTRGGTVALVGSGEQRRGYTSGLGAWEPTGPNQVEARIIDFNFERESGAPVGTALNVYTLTFEDPEQGRFESFSGSFSGQQFALGQNPLNPTEPPVRSFGREFTGQRIPGK